jgi:hypothetical protein
MNRDVKVWLRIWRMASSASGSRASPSAVCVSVCIQRQCSEYSDSVIKASPRTRDCSYTSCSFRRPYHTKLAVISINRHAPNR